MKKVITSVAFFCVTTLSLVALSANASASFELIQLSVKDKSIAVEFADTFERRAQGLMFRKELCTDCGMFFQFDSQKYAAMWMKNTFIPLDVAYIDSKGIIIDILQLRPHDLQARGSSKPVLYALEMNQGWFYANGIKAGDQVVIGGSPEEQDETPD